MKPYLLVALFVSVLVTACHKKSETPLIDGRGWHPLNGPGGWKWVEEDWMFLQGAGVIRPDSATVLYLSPDKSFTVWHSNADRPAGTWKIDTTQIQGTNFVQVDSFLVFSTAPVLSSKATMPARVFCRIKNDSLFLNTLVTPAGLSTYIFTAQK
jgi:hypothetical protein